MTSDARRSTAAVPGTPGGPEADDPPDVLLAEPNAALARRVVARFATAGVRTVVCHDGAEALLQVGARAPRAVLLSAPLPVVGAAQVTRIISRLHPVPVIVGAGAEGADEATDAISAGAVAFVARPYRAEEILPLLRTRLSADQPLVVGDIELDPAGFHVQVHGRPLHLPVREFSLLRYLMERPNRVVSRQELTVALWGKEKPDSNTLTVHVRRVRNKLHEVGGSRCTIDAIRGMGYRLECGSGSAVAPQAGADRSRAGR